MVNINSVKLANTIDGEHNAVRGIQNNVLGDANELTGINNTVMGS